MPAAPRRRGLTCGDGCRWDNPSTRPRPSRRTPPPCRAPQTTTSPSGSTPRARPSSPPCSTTPCCANIRGAIARIEAGAPLEATPKLIKAQDILLELRSTLNKDAGELAERLDALYTFAWRRLLDASVQRKAKPAREALDVVDPIRTAWREACVLVAV